MTKVSMTIMSGVWQNCRLESLNEQLELTRYISGGNKEWQITWMEK